MAEIKRTLVRSRMNQDVDERLIPSGEYRTATNMRVSRQGGSDAGVGKSLEGNTLRYDLADPTAVTIGSYTYESKNLLYWWVTSDTYDAIYEYNTQSGAVATVLKCDSLASPHTLTSAALKFNKSNLITGINIIEDIETDQDFLAWTDDINPPRIINITHAKAYGLNGFLEGDITVIKAPPSAAPVATLTTTSTGLENFIDDNFFSFSYRYKYLGGFYSAASSYTNYQFSPSEFKLDYQTQENLGMVNAFNAVQLQFETGDENVIGIDLLFKKSNSNDLFIIERFIKADEGWVDDTTETFVFSNNKSYTALPLSEYLRDFDNVPRLAKSQENIGSRLIYGNYLEGYNMVDFEGNSVVNDYTVAVNSLPLDKISLNFTVWSFGGRFLFNGITLSQGLRLFFNMDMDSPNNGGYIHSFAYILPRSYTDPNDLATSTEFIAFVENTMTTHFRNNFTDNVPAGGTPNLVAPRDFSISAYDSISISIQTPQNSYDVGVDTFTYTWGYTSNTKFLYSNYASDSSIKSNRSYEIGLKYFDSYNRASTVETTAENTVFVPHEKAGFKNNFQITINHTPPAWADRYKIVVKENKAIYQVIHTNVFYAQGVYRWVKLEGVSKDKVNEGDILIVKSDLNGIVTPYIEVRVLEKSTQVTDFIDANLDGNGNEIIEEAGVYMKIRAGGFDMTPDNSLAFSYSDVEHEENGKAEATLNPMVQYYDTTTLLWVDYEITGGSRIKLDFLNAESDGDETTFKRDYVAQDTYPNFEDWYNAEVNMSGDYIVQFSRDGVNQLYMDIEGQLSAGFFEDVNIFVEVDVLLSSGSVIFETKPKEIDNEIFYETEQTFPIIDQKYHGGSVDQSAGSPSAIVYSNFFNCFAYANGVESYQYKDSVIGNYLSNDLRPSAVSVERYRAIRRGSDLTYGANFLPATGINGLNEFNLSTANFKEDIDIKYGTIQKLYARNTNLVVFQEDKVHKVLFGKDLLSNADGSGNITSTTDIIGQHIAYAGEYGISFNPESMCANGNYLYFSDAKRGYFYRLAGDGISVISDNGLKTWFRDQYKQGLYYKRVCNYDPYFDELVVSGDNYEIASYNGSAPVSLTDLAYTLSFVEEINPKGWSTYWSYTPDWMIGMNNQFFSWQNGNLYEHHVGNNNEFYGVYTPSSVKVVFNEEISRDKIFKTLVIEGDNSWQVAVETNYTDGVVEASEFELRESRYFAYIRRNETGTEFLSTRVAGCGTITGKALQVYTVSYIPDHLSIGDSFYYDDGGTAVLIGTIGNVNRTTKVIEVNATAVDAGANALGEMGFAAKNTRVDGEPIRGYYMCATLTQSEQKQVELFALNSEAVLSYV